MYYNIKEVDMKKIEIQKNDANQTLIKFLEKYMRGVPKSLIQKFIRKKRIKVNGKREESSYALKLGDVVDIYIYDEVLESYQKDASKHSILNKIKLDVAFENKDIVVIEKPLNILSHAASKEDYGNNVVDWLVSYLIEKKDYIPRLEHSFTPAIVNRLDRNTQGLIIGAKNRDTLIKLNELVDTDQVQKFYLAIVEGHLKNSKEVVNYLEKDENNLVHITNKQTGKKSVTRVKPLEYNGDFTLVEVELLTGRSHQIRVTLNDLGHPIVGDRKYNTSNKQRFKHQQLVAYKLKFSKGIEIESLKNLEVVSKFKENIYETFHSIKEVS